MGKKFMLSLLLMIGCHFSQAGEADLAGFKEQIRQLNQSLQELNQKVDFQSHRIDALEEENTSLKSSLGSGGSGAPVVLPPPPSTWESSPGGVWTGAFKQGLQAFNPEIGVVADVLTKVTQDKEDAEGNNKISVREIELIFGHDIDPYARFDSTLTLSDFEDPDIEEAYITYWGLPFGLRGRVGRLRPKIGKASAIHGDMLETADELGLPEDPEFRSALVGYLEWGSRLAVINSQPGAQVDEHAPMPKWGWGEVGGPYTGP